jgi:hypothetical protein
MDTVESTDTYATAVHVVSGFQPIAGQTFFRIAPGDVAHSAIPYRASRRDTPEESGIQMPPIGTHLVDTAGMALLDSWISGMPR